MFFINYLTIVVRKASTVFPQSDDIEELTFTLYSLFYQELHWVQEKGDEKVKK
jgi:hypothetical protein